MPDSFVGCFQPYTLSILDSHSAGGFSTRQIVTFPTRRKLTRFRRFLRRKCRARRRGNWAIIPGSDLISQAVDYAARHGSYVYNLPVKKVPSSQRIQDEDSDEAAESEDENVPETDLLSEDEN